MCGAYYMHVRGMQTVHMINSFLITTVALVCLSFHHKGLGSSIGRGFDSRGRVGGGTQVLRFSFP